MTRRFLAAALCAAWLAAMAPAAAAAGRYDPRLRFRSIRTAHFTIHVHQGEEQQAQHLARIVERVRTDLEARLRLKAPAHTHVVLVDQSDSANGWSTPFPYNLMEITLVSPAPQGFLGQHDDWLRMVFTHEYTHIMHLDQVGGWMRGFRWILGRHALSFPNQYLPAWQIEGIATVEESATGLGRLHAADVGAVTRAQGAAHRTPPLDQLGGGLAAWPWGWGPYFYGGLFHDYLVRQQGESSLGELARQTARRFPYFGGGAFTAVYGKKAPALWRAFQATVSAASVPGSSDDRFPGATRLTTAGYVTSSPRFDPRGEASPIGSAQVFYSSTTAHRFPSLRRVDTSGLADHHVVTRYLGETIAFAGDWVVYDQVEFDGPVALKSDLYAHASGTGRTVRLTRGARLSDPDVSTDGTKLVAVRARPGSKTLVVFPWSRSGAGVPTVAVSPSAELALPDCSFATPRWSPDGRFVASAVHCTGQLPEILLFAPGGGGWSIVAPDRRARDITPAWTPDGRWLVFASDRGGGEFRLYAVDMSIRNAAARRLLSVPGGVTSPDVSPDGRTLAYLSATAGGVDVFVSPMPDPVAAPEASAADVPASLPAVTPDAADPGPASVAGGALPGRPYTPWSTLLPRAWSPLLAVDGERVDVGATIGGSDALARHAYWISATWPASRLSTSPGLPSYPRLDWQASYVYDRWRPTLFVSTSDQTDPVIVGFADSSDTVTAESRTREVFGGLVFPVRHVRGSHTLLFGATLHDQRIGLADRDVRRRRNGLRAAWAFGSARHYGYSISPESGIRIGAAIEHVMPSLGADGRATTATGEVRAYLPGGFSHAVFALRAAAGFSGGDASVRRVLANGGHRAWLSTVSFDRRALGLLRGFAEDSFRGTALVGANADYRFPIVNIERGVRAWPIFLNSLHGAVFGDFGAVGSGLDALDRRAWSAGAEAAANVTVGYAFQLTLAGGAAWTHDDTRPTRPGRGVLFVRTGYAF